MPETADFASFQLPSRGGERVLRGSCLGLPGPFLRQQTGAQIRFSAVKRKVGRGERESSERQLDTIKSSAIHLSHP